MTFLRKHWPIEEWLMGWANAASCQQLLLEMGLLLQDMFAEVESCGPSPNRTALSVCTLCR